MSEILFKLFDLLLGGLLEKRRARKALVQEFETLKRRVLYVGLINDLPVELHKLRVFFIERGLEESPRVREFFSNWLTNPVVVSGTAALNVFSNEAIENIQEQLDALQI